MPLVDLRVWGDEGEQPWDGKSVGEIQVRGPFITGSYHEVPVSAEVHRRRLAAHGRRRVGRRAGLRAHHRPHQDLIKSGEWISSVDLENALMAHPSVAEAAVIAIPDEKWSERPLACVVLKKGADAGASALNEHLLKHRFAKWQLPERYEFIEAVPRTSTGKFWKIKLLNDSEIGCPALTWPTVAGPGAARAAHTSGNGAPR